MIKLKKTELIAFEWEKISSNPDTYKADVQGGWLFRVEVPAFTVGEDRGYPVPISVALTFVPRQKSES